jgi:hypothetical protein
MMPLEQDWRLEVRLDGDPPGPIERRLRRGSGVATNLADEVRAGVSDEIVVTYDDRLVFAYGATRSMLDEAREAVDAALGRRRIGASVVVSHWDQALDSWRQVDPPPPLGPDGASGAESVAERTATTVETRTMVCIAGKMVRARIEQTMLKSAGLLGVECEISEHQRLLTTQVSFTVTGPSGKLDSFRAHLVAQGWATIRADALTMSPAS